MIMNLDYCAEERIAMLKARTKRCVCKYCGNTLHLKRLTFSNLEGVRIEIFCEYCGKIEFGVEKEIYQCARNFVEEMDFTCYPDLDRNEDTKRMTVAKVCEIIAWADQKRNFLDEHGFKVGVDMSGGMIGDVQFVSRDSLQNEK